MRMPSPGVSSPPSSTAAAPSPKSATPTRSVGCLCLLREDQASELDRDHECLVVGPRRQHVAGPDQRAGAAGAAEPEQRRAPHVGTQAQAAGEQGVEARRRQPRRGHDVDVIDLVGSRAGLRQAGAHGFLRELECLGGVFFVSLLERARLEIPLGFVDEMPGVDTRFGRTPASDARGEADPHRVAPSRGVRMPDRGDAAGWPRTAREFSA